MTMTVRVCRLTSIGSIARVARVGNTHMSSIIIKPPFFMEQEETQQLLMEAYLGFNNRGNTKLYVLPTSGQIIRCVQVITIYHSSDRSPDCTEIDEKDVPKDMPQFSLAGIISKGLFSTIISAFE